MSIRAYELSTPVEIKPGALYVWGVENGEAWLREATDEDRRNLPLSSQVYATGEMTVTTIHVDADAQAMVGTGATAGWPWTKQP